MLADVLWWGRDNRISEAKPTQVYLLSGHLSKVIKVNLATWVKISDLALIFVLGAKRFFFPTFLISCPIGHSIRSLTHHCKFVCPLPCLHNQKVLKSSALTQKQVSRMCKEIQLVITVVMIIRVTSYIVFHINQTL